MYDLNIYFLLLFKGLQLQSCDSQTTTLEPTPFEDCYEIGLNDGNFGYDIVLDGGDPLDAICNEDPGKMT